MALRLINFSADFIMRFCRQSVALCKFLVECLRLLFVGHVVNTRFRRICFIIIVTSVVMWLLFGRGAHKAGQYSPWSHRPINEPTSNTNHFSRPRDVNIYIYSAIVNFQLPVSGAINIIITSLDGSTSSLDCCVILDNSTVYSTQSRKHFFYHTSDIPIVDAIEEYFRPEVYKARQYSCVVPEIGQHASHVTLKSSSSSCSPDIRDYIPVIYPSRVPGGLAICGKIAYSGGLDPEKVIEWFELQRILGVDKVLIYDLGNPESLNRVFRYYQEIGILDLQPYELPGGPPNRTMIGKDIGTMQFHHDESMAVLECRQRMAGYSYVMSHDLDEYIIPRQHIGLKQFFKEQMEKFQDSAGFYFDAEFFIYDWGATNVEEDLVLTRYRKATKPHWECTKFVFLPHRILSIVTHSMLQLSPYRTYRIPSNEAVIHHYRRCPSNVWPTCLPETIIDNVMTRYLDLHDRVLKVRKATDTRPTWSSSPGHT
uniref:Glycosyltransferase family 92 protein n=1 Tax=Arion vulgaris TaxID=1028688 RepID=A0A0B7APZ7_9EUPU